MQTYPESRSQEFLGVIAEASITPGMTVVDVPSGGAYLAHYLREVNLIGLETSHAFAELAKERTQSVLLYENNSFSLQRAGTDRVLSSAGLHHFEDKQDFFRGTQDTEARRSPGDRRRWGGLPGTTFP